ncbi:RsmD family RNA methyltransferase [Hydromonas duriensis]|uniref:16S rRNA (Guanine(966)-N(2))-methyltransferase RsmD n=1 Tax=Hydromonas duriensis TaxID=1527608 RepID=A0A4R6Y7E4_9BURK|nr:RsmD family RNA methyltransferase [Hydromonas duriensis]TDR31252.1 16S rRNA (guanine(966)-N(2))-methyltransferase RsmD [Hydromonas duriensis]
MRKLNTSQPKPARTTGQVRIIGGHWRRQKIDVPAHDGLRPSSDRVRETVFNWMMHQWGGVFEGKAVLDAFAGSGAFGLECISRGARDVVMIDNHRPAVTAIQSTLTRWQVAADVRHADIVSTCHDLSAAGRVFDWIVLDPPFEQGWLTQMMPVINPLCHKGTWLYVEVEAGLDTELLSTYGWEKVREGKTQQVKFGLYRRREV